MAAPVGSLVVKVGSDVSQLVIGFDRGKKEARSFGKSVKKVAKVLTGIGVAAGLAGIALATKFAKDGLQSVDAMVKLGRTVGATQAEMVGLARAANLVGVEQSKMTSTVQRFTKRLGEAREGTGSAVDALKQLNLTAEVLAAMPLPDALALVAERIQGLDDAAAKAAVASDILGRTGSELVLTTDNLGESLRLGAKEAKAFGVAVSQVDAAQIEAANDAMSRIGLVFDGVAAQVAVVLAPALQEIADRITASSTATTGFRSAILDTFRTGIQLAFAFQDAIRFVAIGAKSTALAFAEVNLFFTKLSPNSTLKDLMALNVQIEQLGIQINKLVDTEGADKRVTEFFEKLEARIQKTKENLGAVTSGEDVGDPLGRLDETNQAARLDAIDKFNEERAAKESFFQDELTKIEKQGADSRKRFEQLAMTDKLATVTGAFAAVTAAVANNSKTMFDINKGFQIADAVVNGIAGAVRTWNSTPYPWNIPLTIAHVAGTTAQIAQLSSQQFQGGRGGGGGGAVAPRIPTATPAPGGGGGGGGGGSTTANISLVGDRFDRTAVLGLIENINEALDDGARLRVV